MVAGARTLVMSLWKVPDEHTKALMVDFYQHILAGEGVADALREAQLAMKVKYRACRKCCARGRFVRSGTSFVEVGGQASLEEDGEVVEGGLPALDGQG